MFKNLQTPIKLCSRDFKHPITDGIMKRQATFKPIFHIYNWVVNSYNNDPYDIMHLL